MKTMKTKMQKSIVTVCILAIFTVISCSGNTQKDTLLPYNKLGDLPIRKVIGFGDAGIGIVLENKIIFFHFWNAHFNKGRLYAGYCGLEAVLRIDPNHADARHNLEIARRRWVEKAAKQDEKDTARQQAAKES